MLLNVPIILPDSEIPNSCVPSGGLRPGTTAPV
jgi:hypothetical protein